jgi:uncharacterized membrane protein YgcG
MKPALLLPVIFVVALSSCTTAYKTGQTPDDVYYSAARPQTDNDKRVREDDRETAYNDTYYDNRYLRMKVRNRYRWNDLNDWYSYDRYSNGYNYAFGSYNNPYNSWHYYYNPYCCCQGNYYYGYNNPKTTPVRSVVRPTNFSLGTYTNTSYNNSNAAANGKTVIRSSSSRPVYNNSNNNNNSGKGLSNTLRTIFSGNSNNNNNNSSSGSSSSSSRTYSPSNNNSSGSSSSSSGSSGGSSGGVSRPVRN